MGTSGSDGHRATLDGLGPFADEPYLEAAGGPALALMGSMPVWAGTPRLDQLSWGWSMDRHAGELSA